MALGADAMRHPLLCLLPVLVVSSCAAVSLNIHVKLEPELSSYVEETLSGQVSSLCPSTEISFDWAQPHISLYLTDFQPKYTSTLGPLVLSIDKALFKWRTSSSYNCSYVMTDHLTVSGQYSMWDVENSRPGGIPTCLRDLSDALVNATSMYITRDQPVPEWVYQIQDEAERRERIEMVERYGSPGVFRFFGPHVTIAWDSVDDMSALKGLCYPSMRVAVRQVALGRVGPHGTVMRGKDLRVWTLW